jgi:hypothetical protein
MRKAISAEASDGALLQRRMPAEGAAVVAMEESPALAAVGEGAQEAGATKRSSPRTAAIGRTSGNAAESGARGSSQSASRKTFSATPVTVQAVMNAFNEPGAHHCSDSVRTTADGR